MKRLITFCSLLACFFVARADIGCRLSNSIDKLSDMPEKCSQDITRQIQNEITASMNYLQMGAYFSQDKVNRPGFAKFFFHSASEERQHAYKLMQYLLMRGHLTTNLTNTIMLTKTSVVPDWETSLDALNKALKLEKWVTNSFHNILKECEGGRNDYHAVDHLINEFLDEQYRGQRDLAGKISELNRMENTPGTIGEFLFDKKLLKEVM